MAYVEDRVVHDADPHLMELDDCLDPWFDVRRQLRVTGETTGLFSSDYPHVEGGRNPLKRFDDSLRGSSARARDAFYAGNFIDLMGHGLAADLRRPALARAA